MILLTDNIGQFFQGILAIAFLVFIPVALGLWYLVSKTKFYREKIEKGASSTRFILFAGLLTLTILLFIGTVYGTYKIIIAD